MNATCTRSNLLADVVVSFFKRRRRSKLEKAIAEHARASAHLAELRHLADCNGGIGGYWAQQMIDYAGDAAYWAKRVEQLRQEG